MDFFKKYVQQMCENIKEVDTRELDKATTMIIGAAVNNGKAIIVGNGGSAAIASHVSVDLTKNTRVRAINFNEADLITCFANDYGYERWVEKALDFYAQSQDVLILISSSGRSKNILNAALKAKEMGMKLITFSGFDEANPLRSMGHINFWVNNSSYNIVEMTHHVWLLAIVDKIIEHIGEQSSKTELQNTKKG